MTLCVCARACVCIGGVGGPGACTHKELQVAFSMCLCCRVSHTCITHSTRNIHMHAGLMKVTMASLRELGQSLLGPNGRALYTSYRRQNGAQAAVSTVVSYWRLGYVFSMHGILTGPERHSSACMLASWRTSLTKP